MTHGSRRGASLTQIEEPKAPHCRFPTARRLFFLLAPEQGLGPGQGTGCLVAWLLGWLVGVVGWFVGWLAVTAMHSLFSVVLCIRSWLE